MTDNLGYGLAKRREGNLATLEGKITFRFDRLFMPLIYVHYADE